MSALVKSSSSLESIQEEPKIILTSDDPQFIKITDRIIAKCKTSLDFMGAHLKNYCLTVFRKYNRQHLKITIEFDKSHLESDGYMQIITTFFTTSTYDFLIRNISWKELTQSFVRIDELCRQIWYCLPIHCSALSSTFTDGHTQENFKKIIEILTDFGNKLGFTIKEYIMTNSQLVIHIVTSFADNPDRTFTIIKHGFVGYQVIVSTTVNDITDMISRVLYRDSIDYDFLIKQLCCVFPTLVPCISK